MKLSRRSLLALLCFLSACSGLGGEPQIVATFPPNAGYPAQLPDLASGAVIFAEHCTACHGIGGAGDGEEVRLDKVPDPGDFTDPAQTRADSPRQWYETITNGNLERLMPPWADALSDQQRWDVALYVYALHYSPNDFARAEAICNEATCPNLADIEVEPQRLALISDEQLHATLSESVEDEADAWALVSYLRAQTVQNIESALEAPPTAVPSGPESVTGVVSGQISNGTADSTVPAHLRVLLFQWDETLTPIEPLETTADAEGRYAFPDIEINRNHAYAVATNYRERRFPSEIVTAQAVDPLELPLTIYELTEDPSVIRIASFLSQITAVGEGVQVVQSYSIHNESDRLYTTNNAVGDGQYASLIFSLPPAATFLGALNGSQRYLVTEDQMTVVDTIAVPPGSDHLINYVYILPYTGDAIIDQPLNYRLDGVVRILLQPDTLQVISDSIEAIGPQTIGEASYAGYGGTFNLAPEDSLRYELRGEPAEGAAELEAPAAAPANNLPLLVLLLIIVPVILIAGLYLVYLRRSSAGGVKIDTLVRQIAELDSAHERGEINHDVYQRQRQILKAQLAETMREDYEQPTD